MKSVTGDFSLLSELDSGPYELGLPKVILKLLCKQQFTFLNTLLNKNKKAEWKMR